MTKRHYSAKAAAVAGAAALLSMTGQVSAQSSDALIDKLVDKGILTVKEANELREEADKNFTAAFATKTGMPDWVTALKFSGDFRGRFEHHDSDNPAFTERNRFRYRARFGVTATLLDDFEVGFRLASGNPVGNFGGNPVSANTDLSDNGSRKFVWFDTAYARWTPIHSGDWFLSGIIGKMDNPFTLSPMAFDADYQPEGAAIQGAYAFNDRHTLKFNGAFFVLDELNQGAGATRDPYMYGGQLLWESKWTPKLESSVTVAAFGFDNKESLLNGSVPNVNDGNTRNAAGAPTYQFNPIIAGASATCKLDRFPLYKEAFPIRIAGEYINNPAAPAQNEGWWIGAQLGKAGKKGLWELAWKYERLEGNSIYEELPDDDFGAFYQTEFPNAGFAPPGAGYRGGTNVKGHVVRLAYNLTDAMNLAFTYYLTDLIVPSPANSVSQSTHYMFDLMWKF